MFEESPFSGACAFAMWEVIVMLLGTLLLGVLLGYLIWGWTKRKLLLAEKRVRELEIEVGELDEELGRLKVIERRQRVRAASWASLSIHGELPAVPEESVAERSIVFEKPEVFPMPEPGEETFEAISDPAHVDSEGDEYIPSEDDLKRASEIMGRPVKYNDLEIIEGIGPVISEILIRSGITSWKKLSVTTKHILRVILDEAGPQYRVHKPKTWPRQAKMAVDGEWKRLKAYQDTLLGGK